VRELEGVLRQSVLQSTGTVLAPESLPASVTSGCRIDSRHVEDDEDTSGLPHNLKTFLAQRLDAKSTNLYAETLEMMERFVLSEVLTLANGNQSETARILGITRGSLRHKIRCLGISIESTIDAGS
jgi:two-component system nitrogen regulation response regulator GlnG